MSASSVALHLWYTLIVSARNGTPDKKGQPPYIEVGLIFDCYILIAVNTIRYVVLYVEVITSIGACSCFPSPHLKMFLCILPNVFRK
jgi:hypothetical protein